MRKFQALILCIYLLFAGLIPAHAQEQSSARVSLYSLQTGDFPTISAGLDVTDPAGNVVTGLKPEAITLLEDNQPRPLTSLQEVQTGVEIAMALDPGPTFAFRDANAVTRYDKIVQVLKDWAASHPDTLGDDLSLIPTYGTLSTHLAKTAAFSDALAAYLPNLQFITPSLNTLARALDTVSEPAPQAGMKRTVLFVTSPTSVDAIPTLRNLTERAKAQNVRVDVWIVASVDFFPSSGATALKDLAIQTGGQYVLFSGEEPLPGLEMVLAPLRNTYRLTYRSGILTTGGHTLTVQANLDGETVTSEPFPLELNIQPPNPILVAPPEQIVRHSPDEHTTTTTAFLPNQQSIDIIIEFPDGRTRPLVSTTLFVDSQKVAENTAEPFDHFSWDLRDYASSGQHILSVEAVDSFGLSKVSLGVPVTITIIKPQFGLMPFLSRNSLWVALAAILLSGAVLGVILAGGRIRRQSRLAERESKIDPLTQPVEGVTGRRSIRLRLKHPVKQPDAYLVRLKDDGQPVTAPPIPVNTPEMTFGSDPMLVTRILDDPSVSPLHARLREKNGEYILSNEKSTAGTWVNYELLTAPRRLQHGDVLHIGRLAYRFMLRKPPERPAPQISFTK
jgi:FHA domain